MRGLAWQTDEENFAVEWRSFTLILAKVAAGLYEVVSEKERAVS